ncbi:hypothetical protein CCACVL1_13940 [Corchorus capsularis]|uniref:Rrn7/TAF1B C-terminal cyclin domain-containing protein n=1 Tax=Corchorus capsularis TaxID=210143 RepID=A0A1R3I940_COCAP|nr:hypothetical protein CCACVL1_13940 [Corchorus capsularis]
MEQDCSQWACHICGNLGMSDGLDGFFYCLRCGSQADDVIDTGVADEDFVDKGTHGGAIYLSSHTRHSRQPITPAQPVSQYDPKSQQFWSQLSQEHRDHDGNQDAVGEDAGFDSVEPTGTSDFGSYSVGVYSYEDYYTELRNRYVMGLQMMIQAQCEALVEKFNVKPLICGIVGPIWLRFVASTRIFDDSWADEAIHESEIQKTGEAEDFIPHSKHKAEPHNMHGCYVAREGVLPTDMVKWSVEGELTYFDAFIEIEKRIGRSLPPFPLSLRSMFRPSHAVPAKKLEALAAKIAQCIGLNLPPVNFYAIASRYLKELSLPLEKILPHACRIHEWVLPPELRLSANDNGLPAHVYVMSILVVAVRILYNINGFGVWEKSLSCHNLPSKSNEAVSKDATSGCEDRDNAYDSSGSSRSVDDMDKSSTRNSLDDNESKFDAAELLCNLEARYNEIDYADTDVKNLSKSMPTYLQFCQDVVFAGSEPSMDFYHEEKSLIDKFWEFYQKEKGSEPEANAGEEQNRSANGAAYKVNKKVRDDECPSNPSINRRSGDEDYMDVDHSSPTSEEQGNSAEPEEKIPVETSKDRAIRLMKRNMEENLFFYIPPRVKLKRLDYLHYMRKRDEGTLAYIAHADYYILLRSCARVAEVDVRIMHIGVLSMEKRLAWLEKRTDHCLHLNPPNVTCKFCTDDSEQAQDDPSIGLSNLNL